MSGDQILCKCTRCKNTHMGLSRVDIPSKFRDGSSVSVCPRCSCRSFFDMTPGIAWAWASGLIEIGDAVPDGAIKIAEGPMCELKLKLGVAARHGKGGNVRRLLVPGVPEAETQQAKGDALAEWLAWLAKENGKKQSRGVVFMTEEAREGQTP